jgi:hypothetical protein
MIKTGDGKYIESLMQNGRFTQANPANYGLSPYPFGGGN